MSSILYYSNYCQNSKTLIQKISKTRLKEELHYCCIDNRIKKPNGITYIVLENKQEIVLPPTVTKVPALLILNKGHKVLLGLNDILSYLKPQDDFINQKATNFNGEPNAFSFCSGSSLGVVSDNYSFLDQAPQSLRAEGDGGLRQMHHYATLDYADKIETPADNYVPDKIGTDLSVEKLQQTRQNYQVRN